MSEGALRIGEVAERVGVTMRTIRYYEERGLLGHESRRAKGAHRVYDRRTSPRCRSCFACATCSGSRSRSSSSSRRPRRRAALRGQWEDTTSDVERAEIVEAAIRLVERQLELLTSRQETLAAFADELTDKLARLKRRRRSLTAGRAGARSG